MLNAHNTLTLTMNENMFGYFGMSFLFSGDHFFFTTSIYTLVTVD